MYAITLSIKYPIAAYNQHGSFMNNAKLRNSLMEIQQYSLHQNSHIVSHLNREIKL